MTMYQITLIIKKFRFIYKFQNNLLNEESCKALNKIYWEEAYKLIDNYKNIFRLKYFESRAGVNLIDFEDYKQEAVYTVYKTLKKYIIKIKNKKKRFNRECLMVILCTSDNKSRWFFFFFIVQMYLFF